MEPTVPPDEGAFGVHLNLRSTSCGMTIIHKDGDRARLISTPTHLAEPTQGRRDYFMHLRNTSEELSCFYVCKDYLTGSCTLGVRCKDIHLDKAYLEAFLYENTAPLCCGHHNCYFSRALMAESRHYREQSILLHVGTHAFQVSADRIAFTVGLEALGTDSQGKKTVDYQAHLCRLHLRSQCRWGKQCGNIHVCRETIATIFGQPFPTIDPLPAFEEIAKRAVPASSE